MPLSRAIQDRREGISGAGVAPMTSVWQDADAGGGVWVNSNANMTTRRSGTSSVAAITTLGIASGLRFAQLRATWNPTSTLVGVAAITGTPTSLSAIYPGAASGGVGMYGLNGNVNANGGGWVTGLSAWALNDVITLAVNANTRTVRFRINSGAWTQEYAIAGSGSLYLAVGSDTGGSGNCEATLLQPSDAAFIRNDGGALWGFSYWV